jgi:hypothetical protein
MKGCIALCAALMLVGCVHRQMALPSEELFQACWKQAAAIYDPNDPMQAYGRYNVIGECLQGKASTLSAAR